MQMQLQDAREMTRTENQGVLPIKISKRVKPARQLTVDQLEQVRDNKTLPKNLREYASNEGRRAARQEAEEGHHAEGEG